LGTRATFMEISKGGEMCGGGKVTDGAKTPSLFSKTEDENSV